MAHCFDRPRHPAADLAHCGRVVRAARQGRGLTLEQLSAQAGCSRGPLNALELGHSWPQVPHLVAICHVLRLSLDLVFAPEGDPTEKELLVEVRKFPGMATLFLRMLKLKHPLRDASRITS
jgi:transcriptional regulator with XRE-family HTH domain